MLESTALHRLTMSNRAHESEIIRVAREIPLTRGMVALVDDEDYAELSKYRWYANKIRNSYYAVRHSRKDSATHKQGMIRMHSVIMKTPVGMETDHINGNGLDNRKVNLRIVTPRENQQNQHTLKSSKYPGITWYKQTGKWQVQIQVNKKKHHLGYYSDEETAATVYRVADKVLAMRRAPVRGL